jgi:hypothetical protein
MADKTETRLLPNWAVQEVVKSCKDDHSLEGDITYALEVWIDRNSGHEVLAQYFNAVDSDEIDQALHILNQWIIQCESAWKIQNNHKDPKGWKCEIRRVYPAANGYALLHLYAGHNQSYTLYLGEYLTRDQAIQLARNVGVIPRYVGDQVVSVTTDQEPVYNIQVDLSGKIKVRNPGVSPHWVVVYDPKYAIKVTK